jgi:hypothetical protein
VKIRAFTTCSPYTVAVLFARYTANLRGGPNARGHGNPLPVYGSVLRHRMSLGPRNTAKRRPYSATVAVDGFAAPLCIVTTHTAKHDFCRITGAVLRQKCRPRISWSQWTRHFFAVLRKGGPNACGPVVIPIVIDALSRRKSCAAERFHEKLP